MNFVKPFVVHDVQEVASLIRSFGPHVMASVITAGADGRPVSSFLPVDYMPGENNAGSFVLHLANTNEQVAHLQHGGWVLIELKSPDKYISPSLFPDRNRAPTNVHIAIQCYGHPVIVDDLAAKRAWLDAQVNAREETMPNAWKPSELQGSGYENRLKAITVATLRIESARASMRLLQDESVENMRAVLERLQASTDAQDKHIAQLIRQANVARLASEM